MNGESGAPARTVVECGLALLAQGDSSRNSPDVAGAAAALAQFSIWIGIGAAVIAAAAILWSQLLRRRVVAQNRELRRELESRKSVEAALRASEEKFAKAFETSPDAIVMLTETDGRILALNGGAQRLLGVVRDEVVGQTTHEANVWPCAETRAGILSDLRSGQRVHEVETRLVNARGETFDVLVSAERLSVQDQALMILVLRDVTERKRAERDLRASEEKFARAFASSPDSISISRLTDGRLIEINEGSIRLFGYSREESLGRTSTELGLWVRPEDRDSMREKLLATGRLRDHEASMRRKDGTCFDALFSAEIIEFSGQRCLVGVVRDITEKKRAEAALREAYDTLEQRVRDRTAELTAINHELESFTYSVSHDLRAPVRHIHGYSRILMEDHAASLNDEGRRQLDRICSAAERMGQLIDDLLSLSRLGRKPIEKAEVDLDRLVVDVCEEAGRREDGPRIDFRIGSLGRASADDGLIRQVWANLIDNAVKYSSRREDPVVTVDTRRDNGTTWYRVSDNGVGFDPAYSHKLFGVFQRLHSREEFPGTGVGLAIVHRIVARHGGQVRGQSQPGSGATFEFCLGE